MNALRALAGRLMATTEFGADAHTVLTAAAEIERLARELAEAKERGDRAAAEVGRLREAYDSLVGPAAYAGTLAALLKDAGSVLDYWKGNVSSVTSDRVKNELLPAIRAALDCESGRALHGVFTCDGEIENGACKKCGATTNPGENRGEKP